MGVFGACFLAYLYASIGGPVILRLARRVRLQVRLLGNLAVPQDALGRHHLVLNLEAWSIIEEFMCDDWFGRATMGKIFDGTDAVGLRLVF